MASLSDVNDVKVLGHMLLLRLAQLSPTSIAPRLDDTVKPFQEVMRDLEVKDDTIRQDLERKRESDRSVTSQGPFYARHTTEADFYQRRCSGPRCALLCRCTRCPHRRRRLLSTRSWRAC